MPPFPRPLTYAESVDLRQRLELAIEQAQAEFLTANIILTQDGTPAAGPDPRTVRTEAAIALARILLGRGLDLVDAAAFEARYRALEAELTRAEKK